MIFINFALVSESTQTHFLKHSNEVFLKLLKWLLLHGNVVTAYNTSALKTKQFLIILSLQCK